MAIINSFDKTKIYYIYHKKSKDTLLFLHGWPHNHTVWNKEIKFFSKLEYSTVAVDLRGHGLSSKPIEKSAYKIEKFAKEIRQIITVNDIKNPILIGHSFGGMVLLKFEELFPKTAKGLILVDSTFENPLKDIAILKYFKLNSFTKHLIQYILEKKQIQKKYFKEVNFSNFKKHSDFYYWIKGIENTSLNTILLCLKDMLNFNELKILKKINIPCLLIEGEKDFLTPKNVAQIMHKKIKKSELHIIKNATHDTNLRNVKEINKVIKKFILKL